MQVYVELAIAENFCMDFTLLYAAKKAAKNSAGVFRVVCAAVLGACFAVVFPLFKVGAVWSAVIKIASAFILCLVAGKFKSFKGYLKFSFVFLAFSALLGGALIGIFALTGLDYAAGEGFILSKVPIGIPLFGALLIIIFAKRLAEKLKKRHANEVTCRICAGQSQIELKGFFDSGNKVYCRGAPVSVIPESEAKKLLRGKSIECGVKIHTVAGSRTMDVFTADRVEIDFGEKKRVINKVMLGVSPRRIDRAVLHCDLLEE